MYLYFFTVHSLSTLMYYYGPRTPVFTVSQRAAAVKALNSRGEHNSTDDTETGSDLSIKQEVRPQLQAMGSS